MERRLFGLVGALALGAALLMGPALAQEGHGEGSASGSEEGHGHEQSSSDFWKWINFAMLAGIIGWFAVKQGAPYFRSRTQEIRKELDEAGRLKQEAEQRYAAVEARLKALGAEIEKLRAGSRVELDAELARLKAETATQLEKIEHQGQNQVEAALKSARVELRNYASRLAIELAEQRVRQRVTPDAERAMIDQFLNRLEEDIQQNPSS